MGLRVYKQKRDFQITPEPPAKEKGSKGKRLRFVIQKHHASRLHYDFRLEHHHVLLSWAVPKGPSNDPNDKRLAVRVEDHPFDYKDFEGIIPEGEYGAGEVIVWDEGTFIPELDGKPIDSRRDAERVIEEGLVKGKLSFFMDGKKMHGSWTLIKIRGQDKNWLLVKHDDEFADEDDGLNEDDHSVKSGKTLEELKEESDNGEDVARWSSHRSKRGKSSVAAARAKLRGFSHQEEAVEPRGVQQYTTEQKSKSSAKSKAKQISWPAPLSPMLAYLVDAPFSKPGWIYEPKLDGIRAIAYIKDGQVRLLSRRGLDLTVRYPLVVEALSGQKQDMILDGEIVALDKGGRPSFQMLQQRSGLSLESDVKSAEQGIPVQYYVFDIMQLGSKRLTDMPLKERKVALKENLQINRTVRFVDGLTEDGESAFTAAVENGLEGVLAKRLDSLYEVGRRSRNWLKIKSTKSDEFVICGYTEGTGGRENSFGALVLGYYDREGNLVYAGLVGTGFNNKSLNELKKVLKPLRVSKCPFTRNTKRVKANWVKPELVAEVKYAEWTRDQILRVPVFMHLRPDIDPRQTGVSKLISAEAVPEAKNKAAQIQAVDNKEAPASGGKKAVPDSEIEQLLESFNNDKNALTVEIQGQQVKFSNLNKVFWPAISAGEKEYTKRDYVKYLLKMSPLILPHLKNRPLTFIRFPNGIHGAKFFQKHWDKDMPSFVDKVRYFSEQNGGDETYMMCNNLPTLLWSAQMGALELHTVHTRIDGWPDAPDGSTEFTGSVQNIENSLLNFPDYTVIDLDPYIYSGKEAQGTDPELNKKGFSKTCEIALAVHELLEQLGIKTFIKTSGKTGLHIYVPTVRNVNEDAARAFASTIGRHILSEFPDDVTIEWAKVKRTGKIFFDYNMNARGKTLPSVYTLRTAELPAVSCPLNWDEVGKIYPTELRSDNVPERVRELGDLWAGILDSKTDLRKLISTKMS